MTHGRVQRVRRQSRRFVAAAAAAGLLATGFGTSLALAQPGGTPHAVRAANVVLCRESRERWVKLRVAAKHVRRMDVPVPAGGCPAPTRTVLCRLQGRNWVAVQVALALQRKRVTLGDKRPSYAACPKPKQLVPSPAPAPTAPATTTTATTATTTTTTTVATTTTTAATAAQEPPPPLTATLTQPLGDTCASPIMSISATATGGTPPYSASLEIGGALTALIPTVAAASFTFVWDTTQLAAGPYTMDVVVRDSLGKTAMSTVSHVTVDRTPPTAEVIPPSAVDLPHRPLPVQLHATDACGIASVQFVLDENPVGNLLTQPDALDAALYTITFDASTLTAGSHSISAVVADNAGNTATATPLPLDVPLVYVPVLNYHGIRGPLVAPDTYDLTTAQAAAQLAYLRTNGYRSINLEQYGTWLTTGALPIGVSKPVLITIDDGTADELAWDELLLEYEFTAVLFEVTGYADNTTPGADPTGSMSWSQVQALAANGRWQIAFHAGVNGHADFSDPHTTINLGGGNTLSYPSGDTSCWSHYTCLGKITTTTGASSLQTPAQFEAQIANEITAGIARLKQLVPSASLAGWACPWNACGQWANQYNDPTHTLETWLPGFLASRFPIVFMQTDPTVYGDADGIVGSLTGENRRYRFELLDSTTIDQFAAALSRPAFAAR